MKIKNKDLLAAAGLTLASAGMVLAWPTMDLAVARWFYRPGEGFFANDWWPIQAVYKGAPWLLQLALVASALVLLLALVQPEKIARYWWRHALAWVLVAAFGVGLLVHHALKDQVGRPRPVHVQAFGGPAPYIPALQLSSHCDTTAPLSAAMPPAPSASCPGACWHAGATSVNGCGPDSFSARWWAPCAWRKAVTF